MKIWLNGTVHEASMARIDPADRGLLLGDGLFETIAVRDGAVVRGPAHLARLHRGCAVLGLPVPTMTTEKLAMIAVELGAGAGLDVLRLTYTRGVPPADIYVRGLVPSPALIPTVMLSLTPMADARLVGIPIRVITASVTRRNQQSPLAAIKSLNYLDSLLARQEASARDADDAILLNTDGRVAEASAANLFFLQQGRWVTPPVSEGALPSTRRAVMLEALGATETPITVQDLTGCEGACVTSSLSLKPVGQINGRALPALATVQQTLELLAKTAV